MHAVYCAAPGVTCLLRRPLYVVCWVCVLQAYLRPDWMGQRVMTTSWIGWTSTGTHTAGLLQLSDPSAVPAGISGDTYRA
jgi:hypothetical protein